MVVGKLCLKLPGTAEEEGPDRPGLPGRAAWAAQDGVLELGPGLGIERAPGHSRDQLQPAARAVPRVCGRLVVRQDRHPPPPSSGRGSRQMRAPWSGRLPGTLATREVTGECHSAPPRPAWASSPPPERDPGTGHLVPTPEPDAHGWSEALGSPPWLLGVVGLRPQPPAQRDRLVEALDGDVAEAFDRRGEVGTLADHGVAEEERASRSLGGDA
jgi:hypothetical protein